MKRALFLDRDGTIIFDPGYLSNPSQIHFFDGVLDLLAQIQLYGIELFIVTNQSGIGRGYFSEETLQAIHAELTQQMEDAGVHITAIEYCPHTPERNCDCRKPSALMLQRLADRFSIDLQNSYFIGDKMTDVLTGYNAGCKTVLIRSEKNNESLSTSVTEQPDFIANTPAEGFMLVLNAIKTH